MTSTELYRRLSLAVNGLFLLGLAGLMVKLLGGGRGGMVVIGAIGFGLWAAAPNLLLLWYAARRVACQVQSAAVLAGSGLVVGFGGYVYYNGFVAHPDPQSGLLLVFVPVYQWIAVAITLGLAWWLARRERMNDT
jgi:hypothetical protein